MDDLDRLGGRHRLIVHIPRNEDGVGSLIIDDAEDGAQNIFLLFEHGELVYSLADMQVREMDQFHHILPRAQPSPTW